MSDIPTHTDGRLRHRAAAGALQPDLPGAGPGFSPCALVVRPYAPTETHCPDCGASMWHTVHVTGPGLWHFHHECTRPDCRVRFRGDEDRAE